MALTYPREADVILALPVKGESFLFRRDGYAALVDGGWPRDGDKVARELCKLLRDKERLDIVVCTHGDNDHAGGLPDLLNRWTTRVRQLWLPGRWVDVVPQLTHDPKTFLNSLVKELDSELVQPSADIRQVLDEVGELEGATEFESGPYSQYERDWFEGTDYKIILDGPGEPEWFIDLRRQKAEIVGDVAAKHIFGSARRRVQSRIQRVTDDLQKKIALYWLQLIDTTKAIRGIAVAAITHEIQTRWFDFEEFARTRSPSGGARGFLVPLNAVEQSRPPIPGPFYMLLTRINRESLVFFAPPSRDRCGILFCADSPLGDGPNYKNSFLSGNPCWPVVVTAPHHGSEANRVAYSHLNAWTHIAVLLRAGGSAKQPGQTFLKQTPCIKLCAKCPRIKREPRLTGVVGYRPWVRPKVEGRPCECLSASDSNYPSAARAPRARAAWRSHRP